MSEPFGGKSEAGVGFAATAAGLLIALAVFPAEPSPQGALVLPAVILSAGIMLVPISRGIRRAPTLLNAENLVAFGFVFWLLLDLIQGAYDLREAADWAIRDAFIAIGVSAATMWIGVAGKPWKLPNWLAEIASKSMDTRTVARLVPACFFLGMFNFAFATGFNLPLMFSYVGESRWAAPWGRGQLGGWDAFLDQMQYFGYVLPSLTALLIARRGFTLFVWISIGLSGVMLAFLSQGGGRRIIGVTVGAAIIVWIQSQRDLKVRRLTIAAAAVVGLLAAMQFMLNIRSLGYEEFVSRGESEYDYLHVDDNYLRLAQVIQIVPAEHPYVEFRQIWFTLVRPVPRVFWPGKPVDPGFDLPSIVGLKGLSLSTSIIGEWYITFGWITVVFGAWLHGRLARTANQLREVEAYRTNPIVYGLAVMVLVSGMRSMQDLVIMSYALVAWWAANRLTRRRVVGTR
ncbi:MAG: oligosaccharide repeat unit polymerase [Cyanobacteria bacterium]|nr:oligosaccharide repeat unit polymerase [Cyanobacteriota bacterium]